MVKGLERFRQAFREFQDNYVIIGGTACDALLTDEGLTARATRDIDVILVIEHLAPAFIGRLWQFIEAGRYASLLKEQGERQYYRFSNPAEDGFPYQIELFSRIPDSIDAGRAGRFVPIHVDEQISSLSAIVMNEDYYSYTIANSLMVHDLRIADRQTLICLKARAFLDLSARKGNGEQVDEKDIKKHKNDVFRIAALLRSNEVFALPEQIKRDLIAFADQVKDELPDEDILAKMGASGLSMDELYKQLRLNFQLGT